MIRVNIAGLVNNLIVDHDVILDAIKVLYRVINRDDIDINDLEELLRFFEAFVDGCHHVKEERILFPALNLALFPFEGSPVYVMVSEHGIARYLIRISEELLARFKGGDGNARNALMDYLRLLADHLDQHIKKENDVLFPSSLALDETRSSRSVEDIEKGANHSYWVSRVNELKNKYGVK
ncbi:MAG: hemerythrin domain-containing protein [Vulcanisaeta sp.]|jgi:hemerythrin-like domain-containing protein